MLCKYCRRETIKEEVISIGDSSAKAFICECCGNIDYIVSSENEKKIFIEYYNDNRMSRLKSELENKILIMNVREVRKKLNRTLKDVAMITNLSETRLSNIETKGCNIKVTTLFKIAYALNVKAEELVQLIDKSEYDPDEHILIIE